MDTPSSSSFAPNSGADAGAPILEARGVQVVLGANPILTDVSFSVQPGEVVALMGANGSGKSTLIRTLLGIYKATSGTIKIFGADQGSANMPYSKIGYVPQRVTPSFGVPATALEVVRSGLISRGSLFANYGRAAKTKAMNALAMVGLAERANDHVQIFSGGQAQRLAIARALVREPDLIMLDEPLAGVDATSRAAVADILEARRAAGVTMIIVLHEMGELAPLVSRVLYLEDGAIAFDGSPSELPDTVFMQPADHFFPRHHRHHAPRLTGN